MLSTGNSCYTYLPVGGNTHIFSYIYIYIVFLFFTVWAFYWRRDHHYGFLSLVLYRDSTFFQYCPILLVAFSFSLNYFTYLVETIQSEKPGIPLTFTWTLSVQRHHLFNSSMFSSRQDLSLISWSNNFCFFFYKGSQIISWSICCRASSENSSTPDDIIQFCGFIWQLNIRFMLSYIHLFISLF